MHTRQYRFPLGRQNEKDVRRPRAGKRKSAMKIAVLYICTGKYDIFWPGFYGSAQRYFLPSARKRFFVFSDAAAEQFAHPDVTLLHQEKLGWPHDTLKRYHMFLRIADDLSTFDYIYFFNANCVFQQTVGADILPSEREGIAVVSHPGFFNKKPARFTYDRNPASRAYIPRGQGKHYVAGGVNGGTRDAYLRLIRELALAVDQDERHGVTALWHDESHLNKYILHRAYKLLSPAYCYPENANLPFPNTITVLDKAHFGGHNALRGVAARRPKFSSRVRGKLKSTVRSLFEKASHRPGAFF